MMRRKAVSAVTLLAAVVMSGCGGPRFFRPRVPETINVSNDKIRYTVQAYLDDLAKYKEAMESNPPNYDRAKVYRDRMINRIREQIELHYREYELKLAVNRARIETGADVIELGLSGATAAVGGESVKTILGIALSGAQGTRISFSKNYLRDKTTEILITAMRGSRQEKLNQIIGKMSKLSVQEFTFEEARSDLVEFFYAGTLQGALQTLAAESGKSEVEEKDKASARTLVRLQEIAPTTLEDKEATRLIRNRFDELKNKNDVAEAKAVLNRLREQGVTITLSGQEKDEDLFIKLEEQIINTINNKALIPKLLKAFQLQ